MGREGGGQHSNERHVVVLLLPYFPVTLFVGAGSVMLVFSDLNKRNFGLGA